MKHQVRVVFLALASVLCLGACGAPTEGSAQFPAVASRVTVHLPAGLFTNAPVAMQFMRAQVGYVLRPATFYKTGGGVLARTTDGGHTFQSLSLPVGFNYTGMRFFSPSDGVLMAQNTACANLRSGCDGVVLWTDDGGRSFRSVLRVPGLLFGASAAFSTAGGWLSATTMCIGSCKTYVSLYSSTTGGRTWERVLHQASSSPFAVLSTGNGEMGYAVAGGHLLKTTDGGHTFTELGTLPRPGGTRISAVSGSLQQLPDGGTYLSACDGGAANGGCENYVYRSQNAGVAFHTVWSRYCTDQTVVHMQTALSGVLVLMGSTGCGPGGGLARGSNLVLSTTDGFRTTRLSYTFATDISAVEFTGAKDGWAVGASYDCADMACATVLYHTADGGFRWTRLQPPESPMWAVARAPGGPYVGVGTELQPSALLTSADGRKWRVISHLPGAHSLPPPTVLAGQLQFVSRDTGYFMVDANGIAPAALWRTNRGGRSFTRIATGRSALLSMSFLSARLGYVEVALHSYCPYQPACREELLRTTDGGRHFSLIAQFPENAFISSVAFVSKDVGYGLSARCQSLKCTSGVPLWRTEDGGLSWSRIKRPFDFTGSGIVYPSPGGYVVAAFSGGFAVLVPSVGWRVVRLETAGQPPVPLTPAGVAPGRTNALVLVGGSGPLLSSYTASRWALP